MRKYAPVALAMFLFAGLTVAGAIKTWGSGDTLLSSDLNGNFQHIHNVMVGGHGARLVNADVSNSAAIRYSKMQSHHVVPKIVAYVTCTNSACTINTQSTLYISGAQITSITGNCDSNNMVVNLGPALPNATYAPVVTRVGAVVGASEPVSCHSEGAPLTASFDVDCYTSTGCTSISYVITVYDDDI